MAAGKFSIDPDSIVWEKMTGAPEEHTLEGRPFVLWQTSNWQGGLRGLQKVTVVASLQALMQSKELLVAARRVPGGPKQVFTASCKGIGTKHASFAAVHGGRCIALLGAANEARSMDVVCAATRMPGGEVIASARHHDVVFKTVARKLGYPPPFTGEQGFIDQFGAFLNRREAWFVACELRRRPLRDIGSTGRLFSEHLY